MTQKKTPPSFQITYTDKPLIILKVENSIEYSMKIEEIIKIWVYHKNCIRT